MKNLIALTLSILILLGCSVDTDSDDINELPKPLKIIASGENGAIVEDGNGELHSYRKGSKVGDILAGSKLKRGIILAEEPKKQPTQNWKITTRKEKKHETRRTNVRHHKK